MQSLFRSRCRIRHGSTQFRLAASLVLVCSVVATSSSLLSQPAALTLAELVEPSTVFRSQGQPVLFALHGFIEFESLAELFPYIDAQAERWHFDSDQEKRAYANGLLRRGAESRIISMLYDLPRELLITHTSEQLAKAARNVGTLGSGKIFEGQHWSLDVETYAAVLLQLQQRWKSSLNCWSAAPSVAARVLSNWYLIEEGINLFGASYDSTEHFWQAVKYHPDVSLPDLSELLGILRGDDWTPWLEELASDQTTYFENGYAVEFLRNNLDPRHLEWFDDQVSRHAAQFDIPVRELQQRHPDQLRFTALEEKILWGDLADLFHLIHFFSHLDNGRFRRAEMEPILEAISRHRFDGIYLAGYESGKTTFISPEFRQLMFEIWKVKFLQFERFREVMRSTAGNRLLHSLNDGNSPDIPIPIYVEMLEAMRQLALQ